MLQTLFLEEKNNLLSRVFIDQKWRPYPFERGFNEILNKMVNIQNLQIDTCNILHDTVLIG